MKISVIIPYREREIASVARCLEALSKQTYQDFEVIFMDYGSTPAVQKQVEALCKQYAKVKYFYSETRGHFWSCSHAFNQALYYASGSHFLMLDVDLIVPPNLLEEATQQLTPNSFLIFRFYLLPAHFGDWEALQQGNYTYFNLMLCGESSVGNILVAKEHLSQIQGYDTFYRIWGEEDLDVVRKLKAIGIEAKIAKPEQFPIFHQWHPHAKKLLPKGWQEAIITHSLNNVLVTSPPSSEPFFEGYPVTLLNDRPALQRYLANQWQENEYFTFAFPLARSYAQLMRKFLELNAGEALCVSQTFSEVIPQQGSRLANFMKMSNKLFERIKISYRWVEIDKAETELIYASTIRNFLFYFILEMEADIKDYYFEHIEEKIIFVVVKK